MKIFILFIPFVYSLFPGSIPSEGDIRHIYPQSSIAILIGTHSHSLPFILGWIENIDYPKSRLSIDIYLLSEAKEDGSKEQIQWWKRHTSSLFKSISLIDVSSIEDKSWQEHALSKGRQRQSSFILYWNGDDIPSFSAFLKRSFNKSRPLITSFLIPPPLNHQIWNYDIDEEYLNIHSQLPIENIVHTLTYPFVINLHLSDSSYLTFEESNIRAYNGDVSPLDVLSFSARTMSIPIHLDRQLSIGWHFHDGFSLENRRNTLRYLMADLIVNHSIFPLFESRTVRWPLPSKIKLGFDKVYVINLKRRYDRRERMERICDILGLECTIFDAIDGDSIPSEYSINQLNTFYDPHSKRKMTNGEVGCFLSHYRIWNEVVSYGFNRVIVLEDDGRFVNEAFDMITEAMNDIDTNQLEWGLIYLGRKKLADQINTEVWVPNIRHLSRVGYSYWTIGYGLSLSGAYSLLSSNPLNNLVPVDEYIPIMGDIHPNRLWSQSFNNRNLSMYTIHPLVVYPQRYTNEEGHVSDTESSQLFQEMKKNEL